MRRTQQIRAQKAQAHHKSHNAADKYFMFSLNERKAVKPNTINATCDFQLAICLQQYLNVVLSIFRVLHSTFFHLALQLHATMNENRISSRSRAWKFKFEFHFRKRTRTNIGQTIIFAQFTSTHLRQIVRCPEFIPIFSNQRYYFRFAKWFE